MTQKVMRGASWLKLAALSTTVVGGASLLWLTQETSVVASAHARDVTAAAAKVGLPHGTDMDLRSDVIRRPWSYIPPQCYTRTQTDAAGRPEPDGTAAHNPCYACHQDSREPNFLDDADAQGAWSFAEPAVENPWTNLFRDRRAQAEALRDEDVDAYVRGDNYFDADGAITLARVLREVPEGWDSNADGRWSGYAPDCYFDFDEAGYDRDPSGQDTGWRVFAYYPFLGTFFPTNGATDDVLIRLPAAFREREDGTRDRGVYGTNLAIVEAIIRQSDIVIAPTDEAVLGVDLDGDGALGTARLVRYRDPLAAQGPDAPAALTYVGRARLVLAEGAVHIGAGRYPEGTEFLHSVRYLDVTADGRVGMARRMKELRYMVKTGFQDTRTLRMAVYEEVLERRRFPDRLRHIVGTVERGVVNGQGWRLQGFIEDAHGALRPQTLEESAVCVGCHSGIGAITDGTFAFPRRFAHGTFRDGWYHWRERGFEGLHDPTRADGRGEFATYLRAVGGGDEFRGNDEVRARFFDELGGERPEAFEALTTDLSALLLPSPARARALNRAYWVTVREQSFWQGRDAAVAPAVNVHARVTLDAPTGIETPLAGPGARLGLPRAEP